MMPWSTMNIPFDDKSSMSPPVDKVQTEQKWGKCHTGQHKTGQEKNTDGQQ